ncbi:MAG: CoA activase, partial [Deltaproteobacteria bacterium]|nr:CoA activase [Deltaproteobacteria bacterium]
MITCGADVGSLTGKAVILEDDRIAAYSIVRTGPESAATAVEALEEALK